MYWNNYQLSVPLHKQLSVHSGILHKQPKSMYWNNYQLSVHSGILHKQPKSMYWNNYQLSVHSGILEQNGDKMSHQILTMIRFLSIDV